jgi:SAM-dependent methyltransferase
MSTAETPPTTPASEAYGSRAGHYNQRTDAFRQWREQLVLSLPLRPGDTVLDVGCGTGLCLPLLHRRVGPTGTIIGIDESEQMLAVAANCVLEHGLNNVRLIAAPVATAPIGGMADAALFCAVHDIMQSRPALNNVMAHLCPGSPVAATGGKQPTLWMWPLRPWVTRLHRPFIADFTGFDRPWRLLAEHVPDLQVHELTFTAGYLAVGHTPAAR